MPTVQWRLGVFSACRKIEICMVFDINAPRIARENEDLR
jgi:hypothetical protein